MIVDNGGYFPINDLHEDDALFLMDAMVMLGTDAVGVGERDLRYGLAFLDVNSHAKKLPTVCANLYDKATGKRVFPPYLIKTIGGVKVGVFGLLTDKGNYGPAADSVKVEDPTPVAEQIVKEIRSKGATVVVLLSQLGKVESEDLVAQVEGIDAVMVGRDTPLLTKGRMIKNTVACYGGEQGQNVGRTILTLNPQKGVVSGDNDVFTLGPTIPDKPEVLQVVKAFEEAFNEKMRKVEKEREAASAQASGDDSPDRFLGTALCARCHTKEFEQWKTTSHSLAWQTLVDVKKDATPDCVPCHVVGYEKPGGFRSGTATPDKVNVQCENCHGRGTDHDAFGQHPVTAEACIQCHKGDNDPEFDWNKKMPKIVHSNMSGETIKNKKEGHTDMKNAKSSMLDAH
jgi:Cytochrome c554 and c-prime